MIIERPEEVKRINEIGKWMLVYGRRKTGKTFLITNFVKHDEYFFVKTDKNILTKDSRTISYETFLEIIKRDLEDGKTIVVDEFHRLDSDFFDFLHSLKKQGKLILVSSTLSLSKKLVSSRSALLGLFAEMPIGIISLNDTLNSLRGMGLSTKEWLEMAILLREPIAIDYLDKKKSARENIATIILSSIKTIPALIGEIFAEEEREISGVYEGILRAIAMGKVGSGEITDYLFSKKLIKKNDPSIAQQYLNNLISFGVIKRLEIFNKKKFVYKLSSPLSRIYYYADEKYNFSERKVTEKEMIRIIDNLMPRIVEDSVREALAEKLGLKESVIEGKDFDVDGYLLKFKKPEVALEVKWGKISYKDILRAEEILSMVNVAKKIIFVQDKKAIKSKLTLMDSRDLLGK